MCVYVFVFVCLCVYVCFLYCVHVCVCVCVCTIVLPTVRAEIFVVVLFSRISRVKPFAKISTSIYIYL